MEWCGKWVTRCRVGERKPPLAQLETSRRLFISSTPRRMEVDVTSSDIYDGLHSVWMRCMRTQFECHPLFDRKPVQLVYSWRHVQGSTSSTTTVFMWTHKRVPACSISAFFKQCFIIVSLIKTVQVARAFRVAAPQIWNNLPITIRNATSLDQFFHLLKGHLYNIFEWSPWNLCIVVFTGGALWRR